ncbi:MAG: hypothetical protein Q9172_005046 [Xanthocarpia lactea]
MAEKLRLRSLQEQKANLTRLRIEQEGKPNIDAGIIAKIGLNSAGVGVSLEAIRAKSVEFGRLPSHLALRICLDSNNRSKAVTPLQRAGVPTSCHTLVADPEAGTGIECSSVDIVLLAMSKDGRVMHTNHFLEEHPRIEGNLQLWT